MVSPSAYHMALILVVIFYCVLPLHRAKRPVHILQLDRLEIAEDECLLARQLTEVLARFLVLSRER